MPDLTPSASRQKTIQGCIWVCQKIRGPKNPWVSYQNQPFLGHLGGSQILIHPHLQVHNNRAAVRLFKEEKERETNRERERETEKGRETERERDKRRCKNTIVIPDATVQNSLCVKYLLHCRAFGSRAGGTISKRGQLPRRKKQHSVDSQVYNK